jgi:prepilin-type N-terminal cleavage/methylation domain-containing protein
MMRWLKAIWQAFTLIELLVVIAIIAILTAHP